MEKQKKISTWSLCLNENQNSRPSADQASEFNISHEWNEDIKAESAPSTCWRGDCEDLEQSSNSDAIIAIKATIYQAPNMWSAV